MSEHPEALTPEAANTVNEDTVGGADSSCGQPEVTVPAEPAPKPQGRVMGSIRSLVKDFVDYTKTTDF